MKMINFVWYGITFHVELPSKVNIIRGDSATGKTYFVNYLMADKFREERYLFPMSQIAVDSIDPDMHGVVFIDRADMYTLNNSQMQTDTNVYVLFGRHMTIVGDVSYLHFTWDGNTVCGRK